MSIPASCAIKVVPQINVQIIKQIKAQKNLAKQLGISEEKREYNKAIEDNDLEDRIEKDYYDKCYEIAKKGLPKTERSDLFNNLKEELFSTFNEEEIEEKEKLISNYFSKTQKKAVRDLVLNEGIRLDGRKSSGFSFDKPKEFSISPHSLKPQQNPSQFSISPKLYFFTH